MYKLVSARYAVVLVALCLLGFAASYLATALTSVSSGVGVIREKAYGSLGELVGDSPVIVVGTVVGSRVIDDAGVTATEFSVRVEETISATASMRGSEVISVIQDGGGDRFVPEAGEHLQLDKQYLLFLAPSNSTATLNAPTFITGVWSGIYLAEPGSGRFVQSWNEGSDRLPAKLDLKDVVRLL